MLPVIDENWHDLMDRALAYFNSTFMYESYITQNLYFPDVGAPLFDDIPKYHYMLQHVQRSVNFSKRGEAGKSIIFPDRVTVVHNNMAIKCLDGVWCERYSIPKNMSQLNHYRDKMDHKSFNVTVEDKLVWRFKDKLLKKVRRTLNATKFYP